MKADIVGGGDRGAILGVDPGADIGEDWFIRS